MTEDTDNIPAPTDPEPQGKIISFAEMWELHERMLIPPSVPPRTRLEFKKEFFAGLHSSFQTAEFIIESCNSEEAGKRLRNLREELEEQIRGLLEEEKVFKETDHRVGPTGDWKEDVAQACARNIHEKIGYQAQIQVRPTVEDIKIVIERALLRNKKGA